MEENIKRIENRIKEITDCLLINYNTGYYPNICNELIQIIKNLIKEYKRVRTGRNWLSERISAQIATPELFDKILEENYIPKSKITEKISELVVEEETGYFDNSRTIKVLQEFLEDK